MQATHTAILCLALVSCAMARQFIQGERKEGDVLIAVRKIFKPAIPFRPMVARFGTCVNGNITMIEVTDIGHHPSFTKILHGGVGKSEVYLMVFGRHGEGLFILVKVYALKNPEPTEPTSTETPTPSEPSTETPTPSEPSTEEPTSNPPNTEESSTAEPTPTEPNTDEPDSSEQPSSK